MTLKTRVLLSLILTTLLVSIPAEALSRPLGGEASRVEILDLAMAGDFARLEQIGVELQSRYEHKPSRATEDGVVRFFLAFASTRIGLEHRLAQWRERMPRSFAARTASGTHRLELAELARDRARTRNPERNAAIASRHIAKARAHFEAALVLNARVTRAWSQLIEVTASIGDGGPRFDAAFRALAAVPESLEVRTAYALTLQPNRTGSAIAMKSFVEASRTVLATKDYASLAAQLDIVAADDLRRAGRYRESNEAYGRAAATAAHWRSLYGRGMGEARLGQAEAALVDLSRALELRPQAPTLLLERSHVLRKLGRPEEARRDLDVAMSVDPRNAELRHARAWLSLAHLRRPGNAARDSRKLLRLSPRDTDAWQTYGAVLLWGEKDQQRALVAFRRALVLRPNNADAWFGYGQALFKLGESRALDAFASYARLCGEGQACEADDVAWLERFVRDPHTYWRWPGVILRWTLLSRFL